MDLLLLFPPLLIQRHPSLGVPPGPAAAPCRRLLATACEVRFSGVPDVEELFAAFTEAAHCNPEEDSDDPRGAVGSAGPTSLGVKWPVSSPVWGGVNVSLRYAVRISLVCPHFPYLPTFPRFSRIFFVGVFFPLWFIETCGGLIVVLTVALEIMFVLVWGGGKGAMAARFLGSGPQDLGGCRPERGCVPPPLRNL